MTALRKWTQRCGLATAGAVVALGLHAHAAPSKTQDPDASLQVMTAGPGTVTISGADHPCQVDQQQEVGEPVCLQQVASGTPVTLTAAPAQGKRFIGWSDFECGASPTCTVTVTGQRYVTARFSPVTLTVQGGGFGAVTISAYNGKVHTCTFADPAQPCAFEYPAGTILTLRRQHAGGPDSSVWAGACDGNVLGALNAPVCLLRLNSNELVGAGLATAGAIPPPQGAGLSIVISGPGTVTGGTLKGRGKLSCGKQCSLTGLERYDQVKLFAKAQKGYRFRGWSDRVTGANRIVTLSNVSRLQAKFSR